MKPPPKAPQWTWSPNHSSIRKRLSPKRLSPKRLPPKRLSPTHLPPTRLSPKSLSPKRLSPTHLPPKRLSLKHLSPKRLSPTHLPPKRLSPTRLPWTRLQRNPQPQAQLRRMARIQLSDQERKAARNRGFPMRKLNRYGMNLWRRSKTTSLLPSTLCAARRVERSSTIKVWKDSFRNLTSVPWDARSRKKSIP